MLLNKKLPIGYLFSKVKLELTYVLIIAVIVYFTTKKLNPILPEMPLTIPAFLGTAISIILSFKLNQSYDRWWEARKIWGSIVNDSRSFVLQLQIFVARGNEEMIKKIAFRQIAWCYSLGQTLRGLNSLDNVEKFISPEEIAAISLHSNKHLALLQLHSKSIKELHEQNQLDTFSQVQINNTLVNFSNSMGMAERIKSTIFPVTYRLFLHLIIYLFIITLSISLRDVASYFEIPLLLVISTSFFLLEKTATYLQDPFSNTPTDTPMTAIATTIEINIKQLLNETDVPEPHKSEGYYIL